MKPTSWSIGSIVSLTTNPLFSDNFPILISGETLYISPLFIVVDVLENSGKILVENGFYKYKCLWFSSKAGEFKHATLSDIHLKLIKEKSKDEDIFALTVGNQVALITEAIESKKRKSSQQQTSQENYIKNKTISPLLSFVSPIMQVIEIIKNGPNHEKINKAQIRKHPEPLIKCKYFNTHSEKFSEVTLPIEAIKLIESINVEKLEIVRSLIDSQSRVIINIPEVKSKRSTEKEVPETPFNFFRLVEMDYCSGIYSAKVFNYLSNRYNDVVIDNNNNQFEEITLNVIMLPKFEMNTDGLGLDIKQINKDTLGGILDSLKLSKKDNLIVIEYLNTKSKLLERSLTKCEIVPLAFREEGNETYYLRAHCHLREDERYFLIEKIKEFKVYIRVQNPPLLETFHNT